jgi:hypothetical protein
MTDIPDRWPVAAVLVWIATRDRAAFRIPAGKVQPNAPASCIFDRWTAASKYDGTFFLERALPAPIRLAEHYILVFRHGKVRNLRPPEEVAQAEKELLARLNDGCLSAWQGERELTELKQDFTSAIFERCCDIHSETYFNGADVERVWPAGNKRGLKMGGAADTRVWREIAVSWLAEGAVQNRRGALAEIARRIIEMDEFKNYAPGTVEDAIRDTVKEWRDKHPAS